MMITTPAQGTVLLNYYAPFTEDSEKNTVDREGSILKCSCSEFLIDKPLFGCGVMKLSIVEENTALRHRYEAYGFVHTGTDKFDFFPFTCGYPEKKW